MYWFTGRDCQNFCNRCVPAMAQADCACSFLAFKHNVPTIFCTKRCYQARFRGRFQRHFIYQTSTEQLARKTLAKQDDGALAKKASATPHVDFSFRGLALLDGKAFAQAFDGTSFDVSVDAGVGATH